nr:unnamed protein product [Callosobruchus chinensis]
MVLFQKEPDQQPTSASLKVQYLVAQSNRRLAIKTCSTTESPSTTIQWRPGGTTRISTTIQAATCTPPFLPRKPSTSPTTSPPRDP